MSHYDSVSAHNLIIYPKFPLCIEYKAEKMSSLSIFRTKHDRFTFLI